jgi:hypothetical protein
MLFYIYYIRKGRGWIHLSSVKGESFNICMYISTLGNFVESVAVKSNFLILKIFYAAENKGKNKNKILLV